VKKLAALFAFAMALGMTTAPSFAAENSGLERAVDGSLIVTRGAGVGAAAVVGTPVAITRDTLKYYTHWTSALADKVGGHDFAPSCALVSLVTIPTSMVWGATTGTFRGTKNAMVHGFNEPFTHNSFSLADDYDEK
jgi:hypothetical protein